MASPVAIRRRSLSPRRRLLVWQRDRFACTYCGASALNDDTVILEVDHVTPVALGGTNDLTNLTTACRPCNQKKGPRGRRKLKSKLPRPLFTDAEIARRDAQLAAVHQWHAKLEERVAQIQARGESLTRAVFVEEAEILDAAIKAAS